MSLIVVMAGSRLAGAQQIADSGFAPAIGRPTFTPGSGPVVLVDEAHHNFHTIGGRYLAFARLLERDGYLLRPNTARFSGASLPKRSILVIANALHDTGQWVLPARPAFVVAEVSAVERWVRAGGALFLIVDHMPMPGAAGALAAAFGIRFYNGFAMSLPDSNTKFVFHRESGRLADHAVTRGQAEDERVDSVVSFTGQAFRIPPGAVPILTVDSNVSVLLTKRAWEFLPSTPKVSGKGLVQGALLKHGKGRVAVFGEAAMFSAQLAGPNRSPMGMNDPKAPQNPRFLLNVVRWLAGVPEAESGRPAQLREALARYQGLVARMASDSIASFYTRDGRMEVPGQPAVVGPAAIRAHLESFASFKVLSERMTADSTWVAGDTGRQAGSYTQRVQLPSHDTVQVGGRFDAFWHWDGSRWKLRRLVAIPTP